MQQSMYEVSSVVRHRQRPTMRPALPQLVTKSVYAGVGTKPFERNVKFIVNVCCYFRDNNHGY